jgi:hypothetical protein
MAFLSPLSGARLAQLVALTLMLADAGGAAAQQKASEMQVKMAFLPKFAAYINWPPGALGAPADPIQLCIIGQDPFGSSLDAAVARQTIDQHPLVVRRLENTQNAGTCHVAFIGGAAQQSTSAMLQALRELPVLTITDARLGSVRGMVHFAVKDGRVGFHIDEAAAAHSKLGISARLMNIALSVRQRDRV